MWKRQENITGKYVHNKIDEWYITAHVRFAPWHAGLYAPHSHPSHFTNFIIFPAIVHACYFHNLLSTSACLVSDFILFPCCRKILYTGHRNADDFCKIFNNKLIFCFFAGANCYFCFVYS